jgi:signal peptidase II
MPKLNRRIILLLIIFLVIVCDQVSKNTVREKVFISDRIELAGSYFVLTRVENTGAFLGFANSFSPMVKKVLLQGIPFLILAVLCYYIFTTRKLHKTAGLALALIAGGGIGNLYDRFVYGSVTDFFYLNFGFIKTGIFNVADIAVTLGIILFFIYSLFYGDPKKNEDDSITI